MTVKLATAAAANTSPQLADAAINSPAPAEAPAVAAVAIPAGLVAAIENGGTLDQLIRDAGVQPIEYNSRGQAVIVGTPDALSYFGDYVWLIAEGRRDGLYTREDYPYTPKNLTEIAARFPKTDR